MTTPTRKSIHYPCPYGNDNCPKCTKKERKQFKDTILAGVLIAILLILVLLSPFIIAIVAGLIFTD